MDASHAYDEAEIGEVRALVADQAAMYHFHKVAGMDDAFWLHALRTRMT